MENAKRLKLGILGLGMGMLRAGELQEDPDAVLTAVCDLDEAKLKEAGEKFGVRTYSRYEEMLADRDVEAVYIGTPSGTHAALGIQAARAGKHLLVEKPVDADLKAAERLVREARRAGVKLAVCFQSRFTSDVMKVRHWIEAGRFGRLLYGQISMLWWRTQEYYDAGGWRGTWKLDGGGALMNQCIHYIDLAISFFGRPKKVAGFASTLAHKIETEDTAAFAVTFENGALLSALATTCNFKGSDRTEILVAGERGSVALANNAIFRSHFPDETEGRFDYEPPRRSIYWDIARAVREDTEPVISGEEGLKAIRVIKGVYKSSLTGRAVKLD